MVHKQSDYKIILISAYLPPENSKWGRDATSFFSHVTNEMYRYENVDLILLADKTCKLPDHALLTCNFSISFPLVNHVEKQSDHKNKAKYNLKSIPADFLQGEMVRENIDSMMEKITVCAEKQAEIDKIYDEFREILITEMDSKL